MNLTISGIIDITQKNGIEKIIIIPLKIQIKIYLLNPNKYIQLDNIGLFSQILSENRPILRKYQL